MQFWGKKRVRSNSSNYPLGKHISKSQEAHFALPVKCEKGQWQGFFFLCLLNYTLGWRITCSWNSKYASHIHFKVSISKQGERNRRRKWWPTFKSDIKLLTFNCPFIRIHYTFEGGFFTFFKFLPLCTHL